MSTIIVVAPLIIGGWPAITAAVTAAVASMGFAAVKEGLVAQKQLQQSKNREEIEVEDSEPWQERERMLDRGEAHMGSICGLPYVCRADRRKPLVLSLTRCPA